MSKHTPGPWRVDSHCNVMYLDGMVAFPCISAGFDQEANARLIAAAPDLLEACQTFAEWLRREEEGFVAAGRSRDTPEGEKEWREWFYGNIALCDLAQYQARAAIAKATGEA